MAKNKNDYFKLAQHHIETCVEASELLVEIMSDYSPENLSQKRHEMHDIEQRVDEIHHDILTRLSSEFITPIDQEDILHLVQLIDDVTDALDDVVLKCYMFHIEILPINTIQLTEIVHSCVKTLCEAIKELKNFKKPKKLRSLLVDVNTIEGDADIIYTEAIHTLFANETDSKKLIGGKAIYDCLEDCCDLCEYAADVIEQVIIKNT